MPAALRPHLGSMVRYHTLLSLRSSAAMPSSWTAQLERLDVLIIALVTRPADCSSSAASARTPRPSSDRYREPSRTTALRAARAHLCATGPIPASSERSRQFSRTSRNWSSAGVSAAIWHCGLGIVTGGSNTCTKALELRVGPVGFEPTL
jgi:hypothetical protein